MPRPRANQTIEARIGAIIEAASIAIANAVRQEMSAELQRLVAGRAVGGGRGGGITIRAGRPRGGAGQKRNVPKRCLMPGCSNPSKGPRWSFLCDEHKDAPKAERAKLLAQWKAQQAGAGDDATAKKPGAPKKRATAPKKPKSEKAAPEKAAPEKAAPEKPASEKAAPEKADSAKKPAARKPAAKKPAAPKKAAGKRSRKKKAAG